MPYVLTPARMREIEGITIAHYGVDGLLLMERAALHLFEAVQGYAPAHVLMVCGRGNNGGDGLACARMLHCAGLSVDVWLLCPVQQLTGDARKNADILNKMGIVFLYTPPCAHYDLIVDGIFGTGLSRAPVDDSLAAIRFINAANAKVLSIDIASGVDGTTGAVESEAVLANQTITFQWAKRGHYLYPGALYTGELAIVDIGILPPVHYTDVQVLTDTDVRTLLPHRVRDAYKNMFGHALLFAGSVGMAGAAVLACTACMRTGTGLLTALCDGDTVLPVLQAAVPVAMAKALQPSMDFSALAAGKTALGIGCGLSRMPARAQIIRTLLQTQLPAVLDADALYFVAQSDILPRSAPTLLTPHLGEAAYLLGRTVVDPTADALLLAQQYGCVVLLKGATTVIAAPDSRITYNVLGTQGMATAGSGDCLTGILLGLLAQHMDAYDAARVGAYLHAQAGLRAESVHGTAEMNAYDIAQCISLPCG